MSNSRFPRRIALALACALILTVAAIPGLAEETKAPKYVFMFIGDGMGSPQINVTQYYAGTRLNPDSPVPVPAPLSFTGFQNVGIMTTYDATSFCPDSASTATSMVSGQKTLSGVLNFNIELTEPFPILTEYVKASGKKVGVISSVSLDHATPAAYYSKSISRSQYYDIAVQGLTGATLDFLAGGRFLQPDGSDGEQINLFEIAKDNGFSIVETPDEIRALNADSGRTLAMVNDPDNASAMQYEIDRVRKAAEGQDSVKLSEFVEAAIRVLDNDEGFFLMTEGGKVDWSAHANDARTAIDDVLALSDAVQVAIDFAAEHPDDTLIIVTGDHETGGLTIGFAATAYDTHFAYLDNQNISFNDFDGVITMLRDSGADFETALTEIQKAYGLTAEADQDLTLTEEELARLHAAFDLSMIPKAERVIGAAEALAYGGYEPLSMAVSHILNNKAGVAFTSYAHTGLQIPVYASGVGAQAFSGSYDNTDIFYKTMDILGLDY
ncbi:MAG: alkaline phosphatase [Oscillospiraceae bacterium]|jgi:alkaline phosphatase|nr:alkaline phosphatase [Oscillospiraceae bacterium]